MGSLPEIGARFRTGWTEPPIVMQHRKALTVDASGYRAIFEGVIVAGPDRIHWCVALVDEATGCRRWGRIDRAEVRVDGIEAVIWATRGPLGLAAARPDGRCTATEMRRLAAAMGHLLEAPRPGRHEGDGGRWLSHAEALTDIDAQLQKGKRSALAVAMAVGVDRSAIYRRVKKATGLGWADYVNSRDFTQH